MSLGRYRQVDQRYTWECLALIADTSLSGLRVVRELDTIIRWPVILFGS
ncbi:hypothetical protein RFM41_23905 [Mesorhizobium sp. VK25A]|uniref:Transposase n=2 Tax=Mesorhizobium TaxID=68287 RepID=A0ABU5A955_9HYPH|nr:MULTISPECIES: hypothetical protein [unclassified Mesorhizobium]MDX8469837.1 hypothetical protein [Mesorhizobium sp. VK23B]MDX8476176.1 hypothetical protein [Mesorhizobium sp. VK23A]MDX8505531.1 hypothetical protein [Mesorhizobium sp. VK22E]MDX8534244.1 hypothetical protein [Mesorhizobium sp. VK25D]MDX8546813.1 hypothetical protein [Mesorhizobium sp. VK25A]